MSNPAGGPLQTEPGRGRDARDASSRTAGRAAVLNDQPTSGDNGKSASTEQAENDAESDTDQAVEREADVRSRKYKEYAKAAFLDKLADWKILYGTQSEIGKHIGLTQPRISAYKVGREGPDIGTLMMIAENLNCTIDSLVGRKSPAEVVADDLRERCERLESEASALRRRVRLLEQAIQDNEPLREMKAMIEKYLSPHKKPGSTE